ncbi:MAG: hypothetical protein HYR75_04840 [Gemmatimonadetes bacterium]|nr:hypothetical protein [Gemmatimonadota bacterium]MBI3568081.1 hypothetical protein [Gemmatimonadota bacterium]
MSRSVLSFALLLSACQSPQDAPYAREVAAAVPAIEKAVGLKFKSPPKVQTRTKDEVRAFLERKFDEDQPALELAGAEKAYKLFGLLPDTLDLRRFMLTLLAEQVIGYYDPSTKVLYVVSGGGASKGAPSPEMLNITITHELVHALQDQYLNLDSIAKQRGDNDRQTAAQAVMEGQATFEQLSVMLGGGNFAMNLPGGWDRVRQTIRESSTSMPVFANAPMLVQETLLFPYLSGAEFVKTFKEKRPGQVPYQSMPVSTSQVMHPERLLDSVVTPWRVELPKPDGATLTYANDLGEFETRLFLYQYLGDVGSAARGAAGWAGDRFEVVGTSKGAGLAWVTVWDTPVDAAEFLDLAGQAVEKRFELAHGAGGQGTVRRFAAKGRQLELTAATIEGRPAVLYVDVPAGASTRLVDPARVRLRRP